MFWGLDCSQGPSGRPVDQSRVLAQHLGNVGSASRSTYCGCVTSRRVASPLWARLLSYLPKGHPIAFNMGEM